MTLTRLHKHALGCGLSAAALLYANTALAGSATVVSGDGERMVFEYADGDKLRLNTQQDNTYMVVRDNTLYAVSYSNGQPMVVNASTMMKGFANMAKMTEQAAPSGTTAEVVSIKATGRKETVAGITGEIHEITTREDGREVTQEVVMSSDARAIEFRDALFTMVEATIDAVDEELQKNSRDFRNRLGDMNMGILRYGTEMKIAAIDGDTVAASRFELPAKPVDMNDLGGLMGAFGGASSQGSAGSSGGGSAQGTGNGGGGLFSGMMDKLGGAEEPQEEAPARDTAQESTPGSEAGRAVGRAFKKLFGD
ncbi:MAG: hypothetical protein RIC38_07930 [Chromatocurvus sp.]